MITRAGVLLVAVSAVSFDNMYNKIAIDTKDGLPIVFMVLIRMYTHFLYLKQKAFFKIH